jgi:hypothetical protein
MLPALVLFMTLGRRVAEEPNSGYRLPEGTKAVAVKLAKGQEPPEGAIPGTAVDIMVATGGSTSGT